MKNSLLSKIFSSGLQAIAVQVLGGVFFIIISLYLSKNDSGDIAWANAVALVLVMALSFGMDQVVVRRIAASERSDWAAPAYFFHAAIASTLVFLLLSGIVYLTGTNASSAIRILPWMFLVQGLLFTAGPLKFFLNAKQRFTPYAIIALASNVTKLVVGIAMLLSNRLTARTAIIVLVACALFELVSLLLYVVATKQFSFYVKSIAYTKLLKEALPQFVAVLFDAVHARADIILLGIISTGIITAEYNLAYRAYEILKLPITIIGPILLARFAKIMAGNNKLNTQSQLQIKGLFRIEVFAAMLIPLIMNLLWAPILDKLFNLKFGTVNATEFLILSICIPIHFIINLFWTLAFSGRMYKQISSIIGITAIVNIVLNLLLIPFLQAEGAAIAFLLTCLLQLFGYHRLVARQNIGLPLKGLLYCFAIAAGSFYIAKMIPLNPWLQAICAAFIYTLLCIITKLISKGDTSFILSFIKPDEAAEPNESK